jgi:hypothetical protein
MQRRISPEYSSTLLDYNLILKTFIHFRRRLARDIFDNNEQLPTILFHEKI